MKNIKESWKESIYQYLNIIDFAVEVGITVGIIIFIVILFILFALKLFWS